ncbi:MAG: WD40 repeat domain-containing protein [Chloroflexi bacterium]|nr:WD40 repeat domain-containing protein [Chloroflexota bacterium]
MTIYRLNMSNSLLRLLIKPIFCFALALLVSVIQPSATVIDAQDATEQPSQIPRFDAVHDIAWSPDGTQVAVGQGSYVCDYEDFSKHAVQILDAATGQVVSQLVLHACTVTSLDWNHDGSQLITIGGTDGFGVVWNMATGKPISVSRSYSMPGRLADLWSPDETRVASIAEGTQEALIWNPANGQAMFTFDTEGFYFPYAIAWSPDGTHLVTANGYGNVVTWNVTSGESVEQLSGHTGIVSAVIWNANNQIITGGWDDTIRIWDADTGTPQKVLVGHTGNINDLKLNSEGNRLASASDDGTVRIWDVTNGQQIQVIEDDDRIYTVDWSPDGSKLAYGGLGGEVHVIDVPQYPQQNTTVAPVSPMSNSPIPDGTEEPR